MILEMAHEDYLTLLETIPATDDATERRRATILARLYEGWEPTSIHRFLGCSRDTVYSAINCFYERGVTGLSDGRKVSPRRKATPEFMARTVELLKTPPQDFNWARSTWSCELLVMQMAEETGVRVHPDHLRRMIRAKGARFGRPRPTVRPIDPWSANERLAELIEIVEGIGPDDVLVCQDEVDIHLNPKIGPMWMMQGQQAEVLTPGKNRKRYLAGSIDMRTGDLVWVEAERKNSDLFISWLNAVAERHPETPTIHVILDNYGIHTSKKTMKAVEALGGRVKLHFLPSYCPSCNFMEHVWLQLHANVTRNHRCPDMEALMQAVRAFMQAATPFPGSQPSLAQLAS